MITTFNIRNTVYQADLEDPIDISIPLSPDGPRAWYVDRMIIRPVLSEQFTGSIQDGGSVNFREIHFNPHGHGTHTESMEHVMDVVLPVGSLLKKYFFSAIVISVSPQHPETEDAWRKKDDFVITSEMLKAHKSRIEGAEALIIRTLPNTEEKTTKNYSDTNFCYFEKEALEWLAEMDIQHLLTDLPSVDREHDGGLLNAHKAFWKDGDPVRNRCTITEFIFVDDRIPDGFFLLEMQIAPFRNDASPSRPVLYKATPVV